MKIVLDARWIIEEPSGIGVYTQELLSRLPIIKPEWHFRILFRSRGLARLTLASCGLERCANIHPTVLPYGIFAYRSQLQLPRLLHQWDCDLFHSPNYMIPYLAFKRRGGGKIRCVATIHDVIPLIMPDHAPKSRKSRLKGLFSFSLRETLRRSDAILTVSETSKRDLLAALRQGPDTATKVHAIYNGAAPLFQAEGRKPITTAPDARRTLLYVGRLDPYKNVTRLVEAFALAAPELPFPLRLKIVGPPDLRYPEAMQRAHELGVAEEVQFTGYVSSEGLAEAYRTADLLTHPSRYEGFGLQLVEAMRCGLPIVCTDGGAQPEVAGAAALVVPQDDARALADGIVELLQNPDRLAELQRQGLDRATLFDWDKTAASVANVYQKLHNTQQS